MIYIDGSKKSGSGTILRYALGLSTLLGEDLHMTNIRAKRKKPGLRPQHLKSVLACKEMCDGTVSNAEVNSKEIVFKPGKVIKGGYYEWDIGTAGSTTMLAMTTLPIACFAKKPTTLKIYGGLFQDFAPSAYHMQYVLFPILRKMGIYADLKIIRPGYVPKGGGIIEVTVNPVKDKIKPIKLLERGNVTEIRGIAISSHLEKQRVSERMSKKCKDILKENGYDADIETIYDTTSIQEGAALAIWAKTDTGCIIGSDRAGKKGRRAEDIGKFVANSLIRYMEKSTVDKYLADQLVIYGGLGDGTTEYLVPEITEHVDTNLWLAEEILKAKVEVKNNHIKIKGIGYTRK